MKNWSIDVAPLLPGPWFWVAAAIAGVLIAALLYRRTRGSLLRALSIAAMLLALANPTLKEEERQTLGNIVLVLIDESTSQALADRPQQTEAIRAALEARLADIKGLEVRWIHAAAPNAEGPPGTNMFADLAKALLNVPTDRLAGVIMITDGQVHDVPKSAAGLGFDAPVHALLSGQPGEFDRRIEVTKAPRYGLVGQTREVEVRVRETGRGPGSGQPAILHIRRESRPEEIRRVAIDQPIKIEMALPHAGQNILEVDLDPVAGELTAVNNRVVIITEGVRENLRVLLVSGEPHAGERTWRNLLKSDPAVDLVHFTILRPPQKLFAEVRSQELSLIPFPTEELFSEKIKDFDLIIFDHYKHNGTTRNPIIKPIYYDTIASYVADHGGALLIAAGDDYAGASSLAETDLATVLPATPTGRVVEQPFKARIAGDGFRHPVTEGLAGANLAAAKAGQPGFEPTWGRWFRQVEVKPESGRTVMTGAESRPLLVLDRKGKGRVALLTSDQAWLWARGFEGGGPHTDLLRRLAHWLMKEPDLEEERLAAVAKGLKIEIDRRTMGDNVRDISVSAPGGAISSLKLQKAEPGHFRAELTVKEPGLYKLTTKAPLPDDPGHELTAIVQAGIDDPREMSEVTATDEKIRPIAEAAGGGVFWTRGGGLFGSAGAGSAVTLPRVTMLQSARVLAGSDWLGLKDREAFVTRGVKLTPVFTGGFALLALIALIAIAWWREGR